jgi:phosphoribosyl 1,2-cyclic phosphodiesterase
MLRTPAGVMLIDAGIGPRITGRRMNGTGVTIRDVRSICLTHLDRDHFSFNWLGTVLDRGIQVYCHERRIAGLMDAMARAHVDREIADAFRSRVLPFNGEPFAPIDGIQFHAIPLAHDRNGSDGFIIEGFGQRIAYATDLGRVPDHLIERFARDLDLLAIESNYDPQMQLASARPMFLKNRIMGGAGHLSNEQALSAVRAILDRCQVASRRLPSHIVLLHRSRQCNCPRLVRKLFSTDARIAPRLTLAEQYQRSEWLRPAGLAPSTGEQLSLNWA